MSHEVLNRLTPASLRTVITIAKYNPERAAFVAVVRAENPLSRAIDVYRNAGGGACRRYECPLTGDVIDTECGGYPMTKHASEAIQQHRERVYADLDPTLVAAVARVAAIGCVCTAPALFTACVA